jgi:dGTPase
MLPRLLREEQEKNLSPFACQSHRSRGRTQPEEQCTVRTVFERDTGRIIYSMDFRRLRHKTQVFFDPQNDHICTRMEHVIHVNYIANTIGRALNMNGDLIEAIALGHDLGHSPFGHTGEKTLDRCLKQVDPNLFFQHERHGLRVVDQLAVRHPQLGMNLTFEVRDGIVSHCGETYSEHVLVPDRLKPTDSLMQGFAGHRMPATLEGCVVRIADKIAYIGRDIEDAARAGIMEFDDIPGAIQTALGRTNGQIINTLVTDIIENSYGQDAIILSPERGEMMQQLLLDNVARIYRSEKIKRYETMVANVTEGLFEALLHAIQDMDKLKSSQNRVYQGFLAFLTERAYGPAEHPAQKVVDYIAGMTDTYATRCFESLYWF